MSALTSEQIMTAIDKAGLRATRPRRAMARQLVMWAQAEKDFTSEELWSAVQETAPWIGRATAFRTVQLLLEFGFLDRVQFADGTERYHVVTPGEHHHHLTCEQCHRVVAVDACLAPDALNVIAQKSGFAISGHRLEIFGVCAQCQASENAQRLAAPMETLASS